MLRPVFCRQSKAAYLTAIQMSERSHGKKHRQQMGDYPFL